MECSDNPCRTKSPAAPKSRAFISFLYQEQQSSQKQCLELAAFPSAYTRVCEHLLFAIHASAVVEVCF